MSVDTDIWILSACGYFSPKANSRGVINRRKPHYPQNMWITTLFLWTSLFTVWGELCGLPHFVPIKLDVTRLFRFTHLWTESIFIEGHGITPRVINTQNHPVSGVFRSLCTFPHPSPQFCGYPCGYSKFHKTLSHPGLNSSEYVKTVNSPQSAALVSQGPVDNLLCVTMRRTGARLKQTAPTGSTK